MATNQPANRQYQATRLTADHAKAQLLSQAQRTSQHRRQQALHAKRLRLERQSGTQVPSEDEVKANVEALCKARQPHQLVAALRDLRRLMVQEQGLQEVIRTSAECGVIPHLIRALQPTRRDPVLVTAVLEAAWILTNMSAGPTQVVQQLMKAAPMLLALLSGSYGWEVAAQCAWALGNLAADGESSRNALTASGAVSSLWKLMNQLSPSTMGDISKTQHVRAAACAAWTLCQLVQQTGAANAASQHRAAGQLLHCAGSTEKILQLIRYSIQSQQQQDQSVPQQQQRQESLLELASECCWLVAQICCSSIPEHRNLMANKGAVQTLVLVLQMPVEVQSIQQDTPQSVVAELQEKRQLLVGESATQGSVQGGVHLGSYAEVVYVMQLAAIRTFIQFCLHPTKASSRELLQAKTASSIVRCCRSTNPAVRRETLLLLGNFALCATPDGSLRGSTLLLEAGVASLLASLVDSELHGDALWALGNIAAGDNESHISTHLAQQLCTQAPSLQQRLLMLVN